MPEQVRPQGNLDRLEIVDNTHAHDLRIVPIRLIRRAGLVAGRCRRQKPMHRECFLTTIPGVTMSIRVVDIQARPRCRGKEQRAQDRHGTCRDLPARQRQAGADLVQRASRWHSAAGGRGGHSDRRQPRHCERGRMPATRPWSITVVYFGHGISRATVFDGFRITGANGFLTYGGPSIEVQHGTAEIALFLPGRRGDQDIRQVLPDHPQHRGPRQLREPMRGRDIHRTRSVRDQQNARAHRELHHAQ